MAAGAIGFLALANLIGFVLARLVETSSARDTVANLNARIRSWWGIIAVFGAAFLFGSVVTLALFAILSFLAFREFMSLTPTRAGDHRFFLAFFIVVPLQYWLIGVHWYGLFSIFTPVYVFLLLRALSAVADDRQSFEKTLGAADKARLDEYFTSLRGLEQQLDLQAQKPAPLACSTTPISSSVTTSIRKANCTTW